jgi:hypothetical protein
MAKAGFGFWPVGFGPNNYAYLFGPRICLCSVGKNLEAKNFCPIKCTDLFGLRKRGGWCRTYVVKALRAA